MAPEEDEKPLVDESKPSTDDEEEIQLTKCGASLACDPRRNLHRYLVLIVMCFLSFGKVAEI